MRDFTADPRPPLEVCLGAVAKCDAVVAVVAHRYGDSPPGDGRSYTELECRHSVDLGIDLFAFLVDEKYTWQGPRDNHELIQATNRGEGTPEMMMEANRRVKALIAFKKWLNHGRVRATFQTPEDLTNHVRRALSNEDLDGATEPYFTWLQETCGWIELRGLQVGSGKANRFPIQDLYIPLKMAARKSDTADRDLEAALAEPRLVIEGNPGSGKSTFLRQVALKLVDRFPILIRIADLDEHIHTCAADNSAGKPTTKESHLWICHYLAGKGWGLDRRFFDRRLKHPETTLLLDGLDEAPDRLRRELIARLFEEVTRIYPQCRFVVTTRPQAYTGGSVLAGFERARILDLDDEAVELFLGRWSRCLYPESADAAERHRKELAEALKARPEIRHMARNPVMLTALAVVHWNETRLPEGRADLYDSIIGWLAKSREKRPGRESAKTCVEWLGWLALGMQERPRGRVVQMGRGPAAELLAERVQRPEAKLVAQQFLDQEEVDSGIIVSVGADLKFWHLTFQEYLAACALAGRSDADIHKAALDHGHKPEWREVMTLLGGVLKAQGSEKVDRLFDSLLKGIMDKPFADRVRCASLLSAMVRDLVPTGYRVINPGYDRVLASMAELFDRSSGEVDVRERVEAAEALGALHPRLRLPIQDDYWIPIPAGKNIDGKHVKAFRIGRYPVAVFEYAQFVKAGGEEPRYKWEEQQKHPSRPVVCVDWNQASAYAKWAGARLLTDAEWSRAAYGEGRAYPWGSDEPRPDLANYQGTGISDPTPVGLFPNGNTPEGGADMVGNVWEWVEDWYEKDKYRTVRGGCYWDDVERLRAPVRYRYSPVVSNFFSGLRCGRD